ncbi:MAG: LAGLIDADG family homing endonuclease [Aigarchaeota archaeon]|nr:LAGLIDADG family homing endonuclease [Candidatus Pelearchaeum maunauluense]
MAAFIRGLADAEGSVAKDAANLGRIRILNANCRIIRYTAELLKKLEIEAKIYKRTMKRRFTINRRCYKRVLTCVVFHGHT